MKSVTKKNKYEIDMCNGSLMDKLISFSLPLMLSGILQLLFNAVDIIVVGRFTGRQALAAVGSTTALINTFVNLFIGISLWGKCTGSSLFCGKESAGDVRNRAYSDCICVSQRYRHGVYRCRICKDSAGTYGHAGRCDTVVSFIYETLFLRYAILYAL